MHEASLVGMHATTYSRQLSLSAFRNDWAYYVCAGGYSISPAFLLLQECKGIYMYIRTTLRVCTLVPFIFKSIHRVDDMTTPNVISYS